MAKNRKESIVEAKKRFPAISEKPRTAARQASEGEMKLMRARKAHEDYQEARRIAREYDQPFTVEELSDDC